MTLLKGIVGLNKNKNVQKEFNRIFTEDKEED